MFGTESRLRNTQVTGTSGSAQGPNAFLYHDGKMSDFGHSPMERSAAEKVSTNGEVTGQAEVNGGDFHAFLYRRVR